MSKNSKNAQRIKQAKTRNRKDGFKGPAKTTCLHKKARAWYRLGNDNNPKNKKGNKSVDKQAQPE
jgi:hypothetical protein